MITGIGLDIVELARIATIDERTSKFRKRILTPYEIDLYNTYSKLRKIEFLAGRFAAKEAFSKALGTGIGSACNFTDIEIRVDALGKPELSFKGEKINGFISITHTKNIAAAQVILQA